MPQLRLLSSANAAEKLPNRKSTGRPSNHSGILFSLHSMFCKTFPTGAPSEQQEIRRLLPAASHTALERCGATQPCQLVANSHHGYDVLWLLWCVMTYWVHVATGTSCLASSNPNLLQAAPCSPLPVCKCHPSLPGFFDPPISTCWLIGVPNVDRNNLH
jgi:hypothetical protein